MTSPFWWGRSISRSAWRLTLWTRSCYLPKRDRYFQHLCMGSLARLMLGKCDRWFYTDFGHFGPSGWSGFPAACPLNYMGICWVCFFFGDTSFGPLRFGGYIPPNWCQLKVNSLTNELNAGPEFQRSRLRKTHRRCVTCWLRLGLHWMDQRGTSLKNGPYPEDRPRDDAPSRSKKKTHVAMASRTAERLAASLPAKWSLEEKITGTANSRAGPGSADLIHHGFPWGVYLILGGRDF